MTDIISFSRFRTDVCTKRQSLTSEEQINAAKKLLSRFVLSEQVQKSEHIGLYFSVNGEIATELLIRHCWQQNKQVYLPILHPFCKGHLLFLHYKLGDPLVLNLFGIPQPRLNVHAVMPANNLDLIFAPLVAFDEKGNRLGMGGGYYDRLFAHVAKPARLGLAHDWQKVKRLVINPWDIPLSEVITPSKHWIF